MKKLWTLIDCQKFAEAKGGRCLSIQYKNNYTPMLWECGFNHQWPTLFKSIREGTWCPHCNGNARGSIEACQKLAAEKGGKCLSNEYTTNCATMLWECGCGYQWPTSAACINRGTWCPHCAGVTSPVIEDCQKVAEERGGKCLSGVFTNALTPLIWECGEKHTWPALFNSIKHGNWCPDCCSHKTQKNMVIILKQLLGQMPEPNARPFSWLINPKTNRRLEIDIWFAELKLGIEYDGEQHFKPVDFSGKKSNEQIEKDFKNLLYRDRLKNKLILDHIGSDGNEITHFIRFNYKEKINKDLILEKLIKAGVPLGEYNG